MDICSLTSQFPHCGNAFRADMYRWCSFGCRYCFAQTRQGRFTNTASNDTATRKQIASIRHAGGIVGELIQHCVPIHLGGMSDPFQPCEFEEELTLHFIKTLESYPIMFSTKTAFLPETYYRYLSPEYHVFQVSISGIPDNILRDFETDTPTTSARLAFAKELKRRGFTVFCRIQPLIDVEWAIDVVQRLAYTVDGFTVEHIKFPLDNNDRLADLIRICQLHHIVLSLKAEGREWEVNTYTKHQNIMRLKDIPRSAAINVGDNDLRLLSDSLNCCGLDLCPPSFAFWLKHNSMYIKKTGEWGNWRPASKCTAGLNSTCIIPGYDYADYVKRNYVNRYGQLAQMAMEMS